MISESLDTRICKYSWVYLIVCLLISLKIHFFPPHPNVEQGRRNGKEREVKEVGMVDNDEGIGRGSAGGLKGVSQAAPANNISHEKGVVA